MSGAAELWRWDLRFGRKANCEGRIVEKKKAGAGETVLKAWETKIKIKHCKTLRFALK